MERSNFQFKQAVNPSKNLIVRYQTLVHEEDLILSGNETRTIGDCEYHLIGNITVKDDATLIVRNAIFNQTGRDVPVNIVVKNRANFFLTNATLIISQNVTSIIMVLDEAKMYIANSNIENPKYDVDIWAEDYSLIHIENSIMRCAHELCAIICDDYSEVHVKNLTSDRVAVWGSCKVFIEKATIREAVRVFGSSVVQVSGSAIDYITADGSPLLYIRSSLIQSYVRIGGNSDVWLMHTTAEKVWAGGGSQLRLIDASVETLHMYDKAALFVGWDLPIFGPVVIPYELASILRLIALISLAAITTIVLFVLIRRLRRRSLIRAREAE